MEFVIINDVGFTKIKTDGAFMSQYGDKLIKLLGTYTEYLNEEDIDMSMLYFGYDGNIYIKESYYQHLIILLNNYDVFDATQPIEYSLKKHGYSEAETGSKKIHSLGDGDLKNLESLMTLKPLPQVIKIGSNYWIKRSLVDIIKQYSDPRAKELLEPLTGGFKKYFISYKEIYEDIISNKYHLIK